VVGGPQFTHLADHHARVIVRNILFPWKKVKVDTRVLPWVTFTEPEVARVGLSEAEARKAGVAYDLVRQEQSALDRAVLEGRPAGFAKVLLARGTDRILGATIVGERAGDVLHELVLAMQLGQGLRSIASAIHAYPTFAEINRKLGDDYQRTRLTPSVRRLFTWIYGWQRWRKR
jgi:pyruvate/2-oxoglutarate dehydrogenase complex dihydrolipoamide dehydrogenase (E3) component